MKIFIVPTIFYITGIVAMFFNFDGGVVICITGLFLIDLMSNYTIWNAERKINHKLQQMEQEKLKEFRDSQLD